jgi:hypothetical protein
VIADPVRRVPLDRVGGCIAERSPGVDEAGMFGDDAGDGISPLDWLTAHRLGEAGLGDGICERKHR